MVSERTQLFAALLVVSGFAWPLELRAHAPVLDDVVVHEDGEGLAVPLPGFGVLVGMDGAGPALLCEAALGLVPTPSPTPTVYMADGALRIGTDQGLRLVDAQGCVSDDVATRGQLAQMPVLALGVADDGALYAVTGGSDASVRRSHDGGETWETLDTLPSLPEWAELVMDGAERVIVVYGGEQRVSVVRSLRLADAVATDVAAPVGFHLLRAPQAPHEPYYAFAPAADAIVNRRFDLLRSQDLAGPWQPLITVNYFGGFAVAADGSLWVGDGGGGLLRSQDGGASFEDVAPDLAVSCVHALADAVLACVPASPAKPTLVRFDVASAARQTLLALGDVRTLASCEGGADVSALCASAWRDWERDVLLTSDGSDAGVVMPDAASEVFDAGAVNDATVAASADAGARDVRQQARSAGCSLGVRVESTSHAPFLLALGVLTLRPLLRRRLAKVGR